jgi:hypothetical protein
VIPAEGAGETPDGLDRSQESKFGALHGKRVACDAVRPVSHVVSTLAVISILIAAAITGAARASQSKPLTQHLVRYWTAVAACETGSGGPPKWDWGSEHRPGEGTVYEGGLGISTLMWNLWAGKLGLLTKYPHAYDAPPLVQMQVAQFGVTTSHAVWGCKG